MSDSTQRYRPIDPDEVARRTAGRPRLLAIEVATDPDGPTPDGNVRWGCRVVDLVSADEVARHAGSGVVAAAELQAVARGVASVLEVDPAARLVVRGSNDLVQRLRVEELADPTAASSVARADDA